MSAITVMLSAFKRKHWPPSPESAAWGATLELWLARWARLHADPQLFASLMQVAAPSTWSTDTEELAYWNKTKGQNAAWLIGGPRRFALGRRFLEPGQFLSVMAQLAFCGWTSWMAVNRTTDAPLHIHDSADILAMLIKAEVVHQPDNWQKPHVATPLAQMIFGRARQEMYENGELDWDRGVLADLWIQLQRNAETSSLGWLENSEYAVALDAWSKGEARSSRAFLRKTVEPINVEPIFETDAWARLFRNS